ncbi:Oxidoreductase FAD/NAD(P)-binding domain protein [Candidatus Bipolaricaulis anaerobius]|jgi:ferredoxin--NADP+ reductase|uniref:Oxidoreductase FAD/NAD(P)-binding domain protein n=2 Tax=Candidatus Bipolaricaulis anaerobius TaxID=2026885 RepID=A0A2X3KWQ7_9BACT|nr:Oxidoreductase FAD/NAD(P)-binding domain protein [Candidatus Bipolaricaulis anaerobius]
MMNMILAKRPLGPNVVELVVEAPRIAARARAGQFAVVRLHERGERIPLTLADWDPGRGTITLVVQMVGKSTRELGERFGIGDTIRDVVGPLGSPSTIRRYGTVVCVGGGVGIAPIYPIARALRAEGNEVIAVVGARTKGLLLWLDRIAEVSSELHIATDDGSQGVKGVVTTPLQEVLATRKVAHVWAIGPAIMMKFCARTCQEFGVPATVSLNAIMLDGTGMCGACRVEVGGETRFTCVDGPEFPGDLVNWDLLLSRLGTFTYEERYALERYVAAQGGRS